MNAEPTHRDAIAALDGLEFGALKETADRPALLRLAGHASVLAAAGAVIVLTQSWIVWALARVIYGIALMFLFALDHEAIHATAFRSSWLNKGAAAIAG